MALRPWTPEREVDAGLARALVEEQFPQFKPARVEPLGEGWDNAVFKANDKWVFRFPRRQRSRYLLSSDIMWSLELIMLDTSTWRYILRSTSQASSLAESIARGSVYRGPPAPAVTAATVQRCAWRQSARGAAQK